MQISEHEKIKCLEAQLRAATRALKKYGYPPETEILSKNQETEVYLYGELARLTLYEIEKLGESE